MKVSKIERLEALRVRLAEILSEIGDTASVYEELIPVMIDAVEEIDLSLKDAKSIIAEIRKL